MRKIGLKLWSTNSNYFDEAKRLFIEGYFDYIELYAVPGSLSYIDLWKQLHVPYIIHAPHYGSGLNFADANKARENEVLAKQALKFADELHASHIIFHPGVGGRVEETVKQLRHFADPRILIENKPHLGLNNVICTGSRPHEIEYIIKECGVGFCMDIGHAICAANSHSITQMDFLKQFIQLQPAMYHLSDGDSSSEYDSHENLGNGNYDLASLIKLMDSDKPVTLETEKNSQDDLNDFIKDCSLFRSLSGQLFLRRADESDMMNVYNLNNSPDVRQQSISQQSIALEDHEKWFRAKLANEDSLFYVATTSCGQFAGQIRFDIDQDGKWLVSIAVDKDYRGKGLGRWLISKASAMASAVRCKPIRAFIKNTNLASKNAFLKAGYIPKEQVVIKDDAYVILEYQIPQGAN